MPAKTSFCTMLQQVEAESISTPSSKEICFFHLKDRPVACLMFLGERGDCWWGKVVGSFLSVRSSAQSWCSCGFPAKISPWTCWSSLWEERRSCPSVRSRWQWVPDFSMINVRAFLQDPNLICTDQALTLPSEERGGGTRGRGRLCAAWAMMLWEQEWTWVRCWDQMWPRLRIFFYSGLDLEIPPAGPKPLSLVASSSLFWSRRDFCFQSPKVGWLVEHELVAKGILKFSWTVCPEGSSLLRGTKGDFGHLTGQLMGTPWGGPMCSRVGCPGLRNLIPLH